MHTPMKPSPRSICGKQFCIQQTKSFQLMFSIIKWITSRYPSHKGLSEMMPISSWYSTPKSELLRFYKNRVWLIHIVFKSTFFFCPPLNVRFWPAFYARTQRSNQSVLGLFYFPTFLLKFRSPALVSPHGMAETILARVSWCPCHTLLWGDISTSRAWSLWKGNTHSLPWIDPDIFKGSRNKAKPMQMQSQSALFL